MKIAIIGLPAIFLALVAAASAADTEAGAPASVQEIAVLFDPAELSLPGRAIRAVRGSGDPRLARDLGSPDSARLAAGVRPPDRILEEFPVEHPTRRSGQYVYLRYSAVPDVARLAEALERQPGIIGAFPARRDRVRFSFMPNDELYEPTTSSTPPEDFQWAPMDLGMERAWDIVRGHAIIAAVDNGIDPRHPDHQKNLRFHLSRNVEDTTGGVDEFLDRCNPNVEWAGHGTHVQGLIGATSDNSDGVAGICQNCSLPVVKYCPRQSGFNGLARAVQWLFGTGSQLINASFGGPSLSDTADDCTEDPDHPACNALDEAQQHDVMVFAASGNNDLKGSSPDLLNFPAVDARVVAVGASNINEERFTSDPNDSTAPQSQFGSTDTKLVQFIAPGVSVVSTFYGNRDLDGDGNLDNVDWFTVPPWFCGDTQNSIQDDDYGPCTGTSMAAPHVAAVASLIRSINPLLSAHEVLEILEASSSQLNGVPSNEQGAGMPEADVAAEVALGSLNGKVFRNRVTPLFSLKSRTGSDDGNDHMYTSVPQVAKMATMGTLQPLPPSSDDTREFSNVTYSTVGETITDLDQFTTGVDFGPLPQPRAEVFIFSTFKNPDPELPDSDLVPLYRLSFQGQFETGNPKNVDRAYATSIPDVELFEDVGYDLDALEGYIFDADASVVPDSAVKLFQAYNPVADDHAIFPETEKAAMEGDGFTKKTTHLGYAYLNVDTDSDGWIDGWENFVGTDPADPDTDGDGIVDSEDEDMILNFGWLVPITTLLLN